MAGPDGELGASLRYLSQRFSMPTETTKATLNDIGTEELRTLGDGRVTSISIDKGCITRNIKT